MQLNCACIEAVGSDRVTQRLVSLIPDPLSSIMSTPSVEAVDAFVSQDLPSLPPPLRQSGKKTRRCKSEATANVSQSTLAKVVGHVVALVTEFIRICKLCGAKDEWQGPVIKEERFAWGYPPIPPKNQGACCYYCMRVFEARFKTRMSLTQLSKCIGIPNNEDARLFKFWRQEGLEKNDRSRNSESQNRLGARIRYGANAGKHSRGA